MNTRDKTRCCLCGDPRTHGCYCELCHRVCAGRKRARTSKLPPAELERHQAEIRRLAELHRPELERLGLIEAGRKGRRRYRTEKGAAG